MPGPCLRDGPAGADRLPQRRKQFFVVVTLGAETVGLRRETLFVASVGHRAHLLPECIWPIRFGRRQLRRMCGERRIRSRQLARMGPILSTGMSRAARITSY